MRIFAQRDDAGQALIVLQAVQLSAHAFTGSAAVGNAVSQHAGHVITQAELHQVGSAGVAGPGNVFVPDAVDLFAVQIDVGHENAALQIFGGNLLVQHGSGVQTAHNLAFPAIGTNLLNHAAQLGGVVGAEQHVGVGFQHLHNLGAEVGIAGHKVLSRHDVAAVVAHIRGESIVQRVAVGVIHAVEHGDVVVALLQAPLGLNSALQVAGGLREEHVGPRLGQSADFALAGAAAVHAHHENGGAHFFRHGSQRDIDVGLMGADDGNTTHGGQFFVSHDGSINVGLGVLLDQLNRILLAVNGDAAVAVDELHGPVNAALDHVAHDGGVAGQSLNGADFDRLGFFGRGKGAQRQRQTGDQKDTEELLHLVRSPFLFL